MYNKTLNQVYNVRDKLLNRNVTILPFRVICGHNQDAFYCCYEGMRGVYQIRRHFRNETTKEMQDELVYE